MARIELTPSGVLFNEQLHEYWLDGRQLSGITEAIKKMLHPELYQDIPESILKKAAEYGTFVHQQIYDFDHNFVNSGSQEVKDYIQICKHLEESFWYNYFVLSNHLMLLTEKNRSTNNVQISIPFRPSSA